MIDYSTILRRRYAGKEWTLNGDNYEGLTWLSDTPKPSKKELDDLYEEVKSEILNEKLEKEKKRDAILEKIGINLEEFKELFN